jgi:phospholipid-binding lipoprotein MlaA
MNLFACEKEGTAWSCLLIFAALSFLAGCSTAPVQLGEPVEPVYPVDRMVKTDVKYAVDVYDPWEGFNRSMYRFNYKFDKYIFLPVVRGYEFIMPDFMERGVSNFFRNLGEINNLFNTILQFKGKETATTAGRIVVNTTIGIGGLFDPATSMKMYRVSEDFGQTLGYYGLGPGPYMVLPVMGPSSLRDTTGLVVDIAVYTVVTDALIDELDMSKSDEDLLKYSLTALRAIDARHRTKFRYFETGSPFEYELIRMLYKAMREIEIAR